jgi:redox-sensitive bicupin YhaK (pirin superfamily)
VTYSAVKEGEVAIKILAGSVNDVKSPIEKSTPIAFLHVKIDPKTQWYYEVPADHTCLIYILSNSMDS